MLLSTSATPEKTTSVPRPTRSTVIEFTVTSLAPAVRTTVVNGILDAFCGAREFAGCEPPDTVRFPPCGFPDWLPPPGGYGASLP